MNRTVLALLISGFITGCSNAAPPTGETAFNQRCSQCHSVQKLAPSIQKQTPSERTAWLQRFLERHYPPPQEERGLIIDYLVKQSANP